MTIFTVRQILLLHERMIQQFGGASGVRDIGMLESAIARPFATFGGDDLYPDFFMKVGAFIQSIVKNHPFLDGNKRTAFAGAVILLQTNGFSIDIPEEEAVSFMISVANKNLSVDEIASWLKKHTRNVPSYPIRHYSTKELNGFLKLDAKEARRLRKKTRSLPKITH